jgi:transposase
MNTHANARLTPLGRQLLCERIRFDGWTVEEAALAANVSERTAYRWLGRYDAGEPMTDRSSRPRTSPTRTPAKVEVAIERLRRSRMTSSAIAAALKMAVSTVCAVLTRLGLNRLSRLDPPEPPNRYARRHPGELIHLDVKTLGRFAKPGKRVLGVGPGRHTNKAGWEAVHVAVDDASRLAYVEVLPNQTAVTTVGFLTRAIAWFAEHGVVVREVMTDNGSPYRSTLWMLEMRQRNLVHIRTDTSDRASPHPALPSAHQRQSRTVHPDPAPRMGLCRDLPQQRPPSRGSATMATPLQPHAAARQPRSQAAHQRPGSLTNVTGNYI